MTRAFGKWVSRVIVAPGNSGHRLLRLQDTSAQGVDAVSKVTYVNAVGGSGRAFADVILRRQTNAHYWVGMYVASTNFVWMRAQKNDTTIIPAVKSNLSLLPETRS